MSKSTTITITSASSLSSAQKKEVVELITTKLGKNVSYEYVVDTQVLSGLKITVGNQEFDATLQGTLKKLEPRLEQIVVTTAVPLTAKQRTALTSDLAQKLGFKPALNEVVDPTVLGGVKLRIASAEYDYTLATRLAKLQAFMGDQV